MRGKLSRPVLRGEGVGNGTLLPDSTIASLRLNQAGDMDKKTCPQCGKILKPNRRGVFGGQRCVWRAWRRRSIARGYEAKNLPLATPPPNSEPMLPEMGPERLRAVARPSASICRDAGHPDDRGDWLRLHLCTRRCICSAMAT